MPHELTVTKPIHASRALLAGGWRGDVRVTFEDGKIATVSPDSAPRPGDERHAVLLPAIPNVHSHAFQRGMAGLAERRGAGPQSFWSWRATMYRFASAMTPEQVECVAAQLYVEMLEAGYSRVGEFHYLHHDRDGRPYGDIAEMAARIVEAARSAGIGLTLLPTFYAHGGFGAAAPEAGQKRFITTLDSFAALVEASRKHAATLPGANLGLAPHSLRAVAPRELAELVAMAGGAPIHIHVAEQMKEVEDCLSATGTRPVAWLLDNVDVDAGWCLIHATHMSSDETARLAATGAVAGLCPVTEANLGDGVFPAAPYVAAGGRLAIGSDSNVLVDARAELRSLEYAQRLMHRTRNTLAPEGGSTGRMLFDAAVRGGGLALGAGGRGCSAGAAADLLTLDAGQPCFAGRADDTLLDSWIFASSGAAVDCVWVAGRKLVEGGRHVRREVVAARFRDTMHELTAL